jgi:hypothetical protein
MELETATRPGRTGRARRFAVLAALLACGLLAAPLTAAGPPLPTEADIEAAKERLEIFVKALEEGDEETLATIPIAETVTIEGAEIPYALRVDALFSGLGKEKNLDAWARSRGMQPESKMVHQLWEAAREVEQLYPARPTLQEKAEMDALVAAYTGDDEPFYAWQRRRWDRRIRAVGVAFGRWLTQRREEGYPLEALIGQVLSKTHISAFTTGSREGLEEDHRRQARAFEEGLRTELTDPPQVLLAAPEGGF